MRKVLRSCSAIVVAFGLTGIGAAQSQSSPLGDYRHLTRKDKPDETSSAKVYDNDNLPSAEGVSVVGSAQESTVDGKSPNETEIAERSGSDARHDPSSQQSEPTEIKIEQSPAERQAVYVNWKKRINLKKDRVDQLARELDILKQNPPASVVVFHVWPDDKLYLQSIIEKQKALDQAKVDFDDIEEQARRTGVPSFYREAERGRLRAGCDPPHPHRSERRPTRTPLLGSKPIKLGCSLPALTQATKQRT